MLDLIGGVVKGMRGVAEGVRSPQGIAVKTL
jgi:hypothetical protein